MKKLNKMPRSSYDDGKVLAYDAETSWVITHCDEAKTGLLGWYQFCYEECIRDDFGGDDCSVGSTRKVCYGNNCHLVW